MHEFYPILVIGAILGVFSIVFITAYALMKNKKEALGFDRHMADGEIIRRMLVYAKPYRAHFCLIGLIMLISVAYDIVSPLVVGNIEEMVKSDFALSHLYRMVAVYASILIVSLVCTYF